MERGRGWENESKAETFMIYLGTYIVSLLCLPVKEMQKMQVWSLGWEDALEEEMATHSSILAWKNSMDRGAWWATVHGFAKSWTRLSTQHDFLPYSVGWHSRDLPSLTQKRDSHIVKKLYEVGSESESCSVVSNSLGPHGLYSLWILQTRVLEWVAYPFSRGSSQPGDRTQVPHIVGGFFTSWATREAQEYWSG